MDHVLLGREGALAGEGVILFYTLKAVFGDRQGSRQMGIAEGLSGPHQGFCRVVLTISLKPSSHSFALLKTGA